MKLDWLIETAIKKRTCHTCKCSIHSTEQHMAILRKSLYNFWYTRTNLCFVCVEELSRKIKEPMKDIKKKKKRRQTELFINNLERTCTSLERCPF